jgi:site-specific DNA recombinase
VARPAHRHAWPGLEPGHTFRDSDLRGLPAAGYLRVSSNPDETEQKSVRDQEAEYWPWAERTGVTSGPGDLFKDDDRSASMFATRQRENFGELRKAIEARRYKVVWFWSTSRQTRGDVNLYELAKASADAGVLWCMAGQLLNPANEDDLLFLGIHHLMDRQYSWRISKDSRRGHKSIAYAGKPAGRAVYGYKRQYDDAVRVKGKPKFIRDVPNVFDGNGLPVENSPAYVVREIYDRMAAGEPAGRIARSLEDRGIPTPRPPHKYTGQPCRWLTGTVKFIAQNPAYIGKRIYHAQSGRPEDRHAAVLDGVTAQLDPLVTEEQWWAVQRIIAASPRKGWRPGRAGYLLAGVAQCAQCGRPLYSHRDAGTAYYTCPSRGHVTIRMDWLDAYVEDRIVSWAARPEVYADLWGRRADDTATAQAARADAERLATQLEQALAKGENPDEDAEYWARRAAALRRKLAEAQALARPASLSPVLTELVGPDAADHWWRIRRENPAAAKRLIAEVAVVSVGPGKRGGDARYRQGIDPGRVGWRWLTGPGETQEPIFGDPSPRIHDRIADALRADPCISDRGLARQLRCASPTVARIRRQLEDSGEIPVIERRGARKPISYGYQPQTAPPPPAPTPRRAPPAAQDGGRPAAPLFAALREDAGASDNALSQRLGFSHVTVARIRRELEAAGEIPVIRRRGKSKPVNHGYQPATQTARQQAGR